jgi:hypothetical protein
VIPSGRNYTERVVAFEAGDGLACNVINVRGDREPVKGPVILVHGAGVRGNIFRAPVRTTLVDALIEDGYDVWLENWRASIDLPPNRWTLDQAAALDHPRAVETVVRETGRDEVKAVIHCQGSTSFMMSLVAGLVPQVTTVVSNAVSLHPVVPGVSRIKLQVAVPLVAKLTPYLNPQWGINAPTRLAKAIRFAVNVTHRECDNAVCRQVSFTYGTGFPTLWSHANLNDETHDWLTHEFAAVPMTFFEQITRCVKTGHLIAVDGRPDLPASFVGQPPKTDARIAFFAGADNRCFIPESQVRTHEYFSRFAPDHTLHVVPGYGHLDMFMGHSAARDVFPLMLSELNRPRT